MFQPVKSKKVYQHVVEQIQRMLLDGSLRKGDRLPSERRLTAQLQVGRTSLREALRALEIIGLVECRQGEGNFIRANLDDNMLEPLSILFKLNCNNLDDVLELRVGLEVEAATLAATRISTAQHAELQALAEALRDTTDEETQTQLDKRLHQLIADISGNYLIASVLRSAAALLDASIRTMRQEIVKVEAQRLNLANSHAEICQAVLDRDPTAAAMAMRRHFELVWARRPPDTSTTAKPPA